MCCARFFSLHFHCLLNNCECEVYKDIWQMELVKLLWILIALKDFIGGRFVLLLLEIIAINMVNKTIIHVYVDHLKMAYMLLPENSRTTFAVFYIFMSVAAILFNIIVLVILCRYVILQTNSYKILAALALSDLLIGGLVAPLAITKLLNKDINFETTNKLMQWITPICLLACANLTAFVCYDSFHHVNSPIYVMHNGNVYTVLAFCWFIPVFSTTLQIICNARVIKLFGNIEYALLLFLIIFYYCRLHKSLICAKVNQNSTLDNEYTINQKHYARAILWVITLYIVLHFPVLINRLLLILEIKINVKWYVAIAYIFLCKSAVNPLLYCYRTPILMEHVKKLFLLKANQVHPSVWYA